MQEFVELRLDPRISVRVTAATSGGGEIHLNQLHRDRHHRIRYRKTCPEHGEVSSEEIVSGYEYARDQSVDFATP